MKFHNPYQFIPVTGKVNGAKPEKRDYQEIEQGAVPYVRHDRWESDALSGRLVCRLTTRSPVLVGAAQTRESDREPAQVRGYTFDGRPAIPGSSLRGMISAVAEAISQSALRVLDNAEYSVRHSMQQGHKALGLLERGEKGELQIRPMALVGVPTDETGRIEEKWRRLFRIKDEPSKDMLLKDVLAAHVGNPNTKFPPCFQNQSNPGFVYAELVARESECKVSDPIPTATLDGIKLRRNAVLGQKVKPQNGSDWVSEAKDNLTRGVLYVLGREGREEEMPTGKKHELFIPWPEGKEREIEPLPLPSHVLEIFNRTAKSRRETDKRFPFLPEGYRQTGPRSDFSPFLALGDLLYFDVDDEEKVVSEISFSAIWRRKVDGCLHQAFTRIGGDDILPWNPERAGLTPAECLFGVVEEGKKAQGRNLASRIRVSDALPLGECSFAEEAVPLKILSSPKPPSPAFYFRFRYGYISKEMLDLNVHDPAGRKRYIHRWKDNSDAEEPWRTCDEKKRANEKLKGHPIPEDLPFVFHVDFENLSGAELGLLLDALDPTSSEFNEGTNRKFLHKIGLGKPLGLGSVNVEVRGVFLVDRVARYGVKGAMSANRYSSWLGCGEDWTKPEKTRYPNEVAALDMGEKPIEIEQITSSLVDRDSLLALLQLGNPGHVKSPVCYPFSEREGQTRFSEEDGFKWFVENNNDVIPECRQHLQVPSTKQDMAIPVLESRIPGEWLKQRKDKKKTGSEQRINEISKHNQPAGQSIFLYGIPPDVTEDALREELSRVLTGLLRKSIVAEKVFFPGHSDPRKKVRYAFATLDSQQSTDRVLKRYAGQRIRLSNFDILINYAINKKNSR